MLSSEKWMRRGPHASALVVGVDDQHVPSTLVAEGIFEGTAVIQVHDVAESSVVHVNLVTEVRHGENGGRTASSASQSATR